MTLRDTNTTRTDKSRAVTVDSCFVLTGARQQGITSESNKLHHNEPLHQVPYFDLTCSPNHALPHHVFRGARRPKLTQWCLAKKITALATFIGFCRAGVSQTHLFLRSISLAVTLVCQFLIRSLQEIQRNLARVRPVYFFFNAGRLRPEIQILTLQDSYGTIFDRKGTPYLYLPQQIVPLSYTY